MQHRTLNKYGRDAALGCNGYGLEIRDVKLSADLDGLAQDRDAQSEQPAHDLLRDLLDLYQVLHGQIT
jgi:hypothetical protein